MKLLTNVITVLVIVVAVSNSLTANDQNTNVTESSKVKCPNLPKLEVLPAGGWCNLRNIPMNQVFQMTYDLCKTTFDGKFLVPDSVAVIPMRHSSVHLFSEIIDSTSNYKSVTSTSINLNAGLSGDTFSVSGSFSEDHKEAKQKMYDDKSITTRVSGRYTLYTIEMPTTWEIEPQLKTSLYQVIHSLESNQTEDLVDFLLQMIVRDHGTHVITRVDAGGVLIKEDYITRSFAQSYSQKKNTLRATASASFLDLFHFDSTYKTKTEDTDVTSYSKATTSSKVDTLGGAFYKVNGINAWIDSLPLNPVAIDRSGAPLSFIITPEAFPDVSLHSLSILRQQFESAIMDFYNYNRKVGCMDMDSPGFDFNANAPKPCATTNHYNLTFGGVFQACVTIKDEFIDICTSPKSNYLNLTIPNSMTKGTSCPENFTAVPIDSFNVYQDHEWRTYGWTDPVNGGTYHYQFSKSTYTAYWCAAPSNHVDNSGALFGGTYTTKLPNPVTQGFSCPSAFQDIEILRGLHICAGYDYELGKAAALEFGGFFSCNNGNPLYTTDGDKTSLFKIVQGGSTYTKACPKGYTQHMGYTHRDCNIFYCLPAGSFKVHGGIPIVLPPFVDPDVLFMNVSFATAELEAGTNTVGAGGGISGWGIGGIVAAFSVLVVVAIIAVVGIVRLRRYLRAVRLEQLSGDGVTTALLADTDNEHNEGYSGLNN